MPLLDYGSTFKESNVNNVEPHDWAHVLGPLQLVRTLLNTTGLDYLNVQSNGIRQTNVRAHAGAHGGRFKARNASGGNLAASDLVYITGTYSDGTDSYPSVDQADSHATASSNFFAVGLLEAAVSNGADGTVTARKTITAVDTSGSTVGDPVYLSSTAGGWTLTKPTSGEFVQVVGYVSVVHASTGVIMFDLSMPQEEWITGEAGGSGLMLDVDKDSGIYAQAEDVLRIRIAGSDEWEIGATSLHPTTDAGSDVGTTSLRVKELFVDDITLTTTITAGTSFVVGGTTIASGVITQATGGALNVALSAAAGDDFTVDTSKLVVSGDTGYIGIGTATPAQILETLFGTAGTTSMIYHRHSDNTNAASHAQLSLIVGGGSGGDPVVHFNNAVVNWYAGMDNSDSDIFKISPTQFANEFVITAAGMVGIGDTTNAGMTVGLTINQGANDDELFAGKSSDVAQPFTDFAEADTFVALGKVEGTSGGLQLEGFKDADGTAGIAVGIDAYLGEAATTDDTSSSLGVQHYRSFITDAGTGRTITAATGNAFTWSDGGSTRLILKGAGVMHITNTTLVALDGYEDAALLRAGELLNTEGIIRTSWDDEIPYDIENLKATGLLSSEGDFWNLQLLNSAQNNAIWQNSVAVKEQAQDLQETRAIIQEQAQELLELKQEMFLLKENNN